MSQLQTRQETQQQQIPLHTLGWDVGIALPNVGMDSSVLMCLLPRKDNATPGCSPAWMGRRHLLCFVNLSCDG